MNQIAFPKEKSIHPSVKFLAICVIHNPSGVAATPATSTRLVESSKKNKTTKRCKPFAVQTSIVKKSVNTIWSQCRRRNSFHVVCRLRSGAGSMPFFFKMLATVLLA